MLNEGDTLPILQRLAREDAVGQLRRRDGRMGLLGSEDGALKLDWVEGVARLLADPRALAQVEEEAREIRGRGIRHVIWAGMGGSVLTVRVLRDLGFGDGGEDGRSDPSSPSSLEVGGPITIYPLDSTDPAALNAIVREIASKKRLALSLDSAPAQSAGAQPGPDILRALLSDVMMIGVSMGITSEEPITHLTWFTELLEQAQLKPVEHLLIMTLPGSYLDAFAHEHQVPSRPLQLDGGNGTGGRMSAPATRVFLLPVALFLTTRTASESGGLRAVLQRAWNEYDLELAASHPDEHPFVQLAAALSAASRAGACRLLVAMPAGWQPLIAWIEQLMEESLGKGGKGVVIFDNQSLNPVSPAYQQGGTLHVYVAAETPEAVDEHSFLLSQPLLASEEPEDRLAALAASFLGWQLCMALYGYLQDIHFAGQPAVENYKARARALRTQPDPLQVATDWSPALRSGILTLLAPSGTLDQDSVVAGDLSAGETSPPVPLALAFTRALQKAFAADNTAAPRQTLPLQYLDLTVNGEAQPALLAVLDQHVRTLGNRLLGVPIKLRSAPAAYHSTEQSEMDGPSPLVSLRIVARDTQASLLGSYTPTFLHAQAVSTWQAMLEQGRSCFLLVVDGSLDDATEPLASVFAEVEEYLLHL